MGLAFSHKNSRKEHELLCSYKVNDGCQVYSCEAEQSFTPVHTRDQEELNLCRGKNLYDSGRRRGRIRPNLRLEAGREGTSHDAGDALAVAADLLNQLSKTLEGRRCTRT